jgi:hypothetical protein
MDRTVGGGSPARAAGDRRGVRDRGVCYGVADGETAATGWRADRMRADPRVIAGDLHANAIVVYGDGVDRLAATAAVTEVGCCAYRGAAADGGLGWDVVDYGVDPPRIRGGLVRSERTQARYLHDILNRLEGIGLAATLDVGGQPPPIFTPSMGVTKETAKAN